MAAFEVDGIDALQWTSGSYNPDGTFAQWFPLYDQVKRAGKGLWVQVYNDGVDQWIERIDTLVRRYGSNALFLNFPDMDMASADRLITYAEKNVKGIKAVEIGENAGKVRIRHGEKTRIDAFTGG